MTPAEALVERTRRAQGLPPIIEDTVAIRAVASVIAASRQRKAGEQRDAA